MNKRSRIARKIEYVIRHQREISDAVTESRFLSGGHTGGGGHAFISDTTASSAIRRMAEVRFVSFEGSAIRRAQKGRRRTVRLVRFSDGLEYPERWLRLVELLREWCRGDAVDAEIFRRALYRVKPKLRYERQELQGKICKDLHISEPMFYKHVEKIFTYALGLYRVILEPQASRGL